MPRACGEGCFGANNEALSAGMLQVVKTRILTEWGRGGHEVSQGKRSRLGALSGVLPGGRLSWAPDCTEPEGA